MKCLLSTSGQSSVATAQALTEAAVDFVRSQDLDTDWLSEKVPGIDFVCAVLDTQGMDDSPAIYLEIGVALGRNLPVLIITDSRRRIPLALAGLQRVEADLDNHAAIALHIRQFTSNLKEKRLSRSASESERNRDQAFSGLREQIEALRTSPLDKTLSPTPSLGFQYENLVQKIFETAGETAFPGPTSARDEGCDLAAWVDGASQLLGGPILIQCKIAKRISAGGLERQAARLGDILYTRSVNFGLIVYHSTNDPRHRITLHSRYSVWAISALELVNTAASGSLSRWIIMRRNELMHGAGRHERH